MTPPTLEDASTYLLRRLPPSWSPAPTCHDASYTKGPPGPTHGDAPHTRSPPIPFARPLPLENRHYPLAATPLTLEIRRDPPIAMPHTPEDYQHTPVATFPHLNPASTHTLAAFHDSRTASPSLESQPRPEPATPPILAHEPGSAAYGPPLTFTLQFRNAGREGLAQTEPTPPALPRRNPDLWARQDTATQATLGARYPSDTSALQRPSSHLRDPGPTAPRTAPPSTGTRPSPSKAVPAHSHPTTPTSSS